jgi:hypothetical protein
MLLALLAAAVVARSPAPYVAPDGRTESQLISAHVLPDLAHPGVVNPAVTADTIGKTICIHGWTATVRPPTGATNKLKASLLPPGRKLLDYELDHRLSIEDGGAPADPRNLWMMVYDDRYGARVKDVLETKLARSVCKGQIPLDVARAALMGNWLIAYQKFVGPLP